MNEYHLPDEFYNPRHLSTKYTQVENPTLDERPSRSPMRIIEQGKQMIFRMDVLGEGTMEMVVESTPFTGKLIYRECG